MKRHSLIFTLIVLALTACAQTAQPPRPSPTPPRAAEPTVVQSAPTTAVAPSAPPVVSAQAVTPPTSAPTVSEAGVQRLQPSPTVGEQPRGHQGAAVPTPSNPSFLATEILGRPTDRSVTVNVVPAAGLAITYEYGTAPGEYSSHTAPQAGTAGVPVETLIDGLQPNTRYYYRIRYGDAAGPEHSFMTQRAPGSSFTFALQGDSHPERVGKQFDPALYTRTLQSAAADQPDFYMTIGDDFSVDTLKTVNAETVQALYRSQRQWLGLVGAPVFLVNGNHEQAALANLDGTPDNVAVWAQTARNASYPQPAPDEFYSGDTEPVEPIGLLRDYYAFTWGNALFVVIDPYWHSPQPVDNQFGAERGQRQDRDLWQITLGEAQYQWFRRTLETSGARFKFVFAHHVNGTGRGGVELAASYEWGDAAHLAAHRPGWEKTIHQLMVDNGVTIFFQGHDHLFARQERDGVIYQTLPEPANPFGSIENADAYQSGDTLPNSGHVRVTVTPDGITVDYIRSYLDRPDERAFSYTAPAGSTGHAQPSMPPQVAQPTQAPVAAPSSQAPVAIPATQPVNLILGRPTNDSVTVSLLSATARQITIAYGTQPGQYTQQTRAIALQANLPSTIDLAPLRPDTTYYYQALADGTPLGEHTVHTQRAPGSSFTFTIDADPHNRDPRFDGALYTTTLRNAAADQPDFHINLGDTFMTEKARPQSYAEAEATFAEMRPSFGVLGANVPLFLVNGNHEGELGWLLHGNANDLPVWATRLRQAYYPNPTPNGFYSGATQADAALGAVRDGYYAWRWGDALFIVLDPFWYTTRKPRPGDLAGGWGWTLGRAQYDWLTATLEASDARYTFVFIHHLVGGGEEARGGIEVADRYEWGGHNADGSEGFATQRSGWGKPIHQILVEHHVSAVFHGHDHVFVKQDLDGIVYQEVPQPSTTDDRQTSLAADYGYTHGDALGGAGHLRVTVAPEQVTVAYVRASLSYSGSPDQQNGQVAYDYTVVR